MAILIAATAGHAGPTQAGPRLRAATTDGVAVLRSPGPDRVLIPEGTFTMGSDVDQIAQAISLCRAEPAGQDCQLDAFANEFAPHPVLLSAYFLDRLEVTVRSYERCVEAGPCQRLPLAAGGTRFRTANWPVTMVTHGEARQYCEFVGGRLPSEAEWERAARGLGGARRYPFGQIFDPYLVNGGRFSLDFYEDKDGYLELAPVGSFPLGGTAAGVQDLAGNAEEWVADWYAPEYPEATEVNPKGPGSGDERVVRGGSFASGRAWMRGAARGHDLPSARRPWRGFRCAYSR